MAWAKHKERERGQHKKAPSKPYMCGGGGGTSLRRLIIRVQVHLKESAPRVSSVEERYPDKTSFWSGFKRQSCKCVFHIRTIWRGFAKIKYFSEWLGMLLETSGGQILIPGRRPHWTALNLADLMMLDKWASGQLKSPWPMASPRANHV